MKTKEEKLDKRILANRFTGIQRRRWNLSLSSFLKRFFEFNGISKNTICSHLSDLEIRKLMIEVAKTCYGLGLQDSHILHNTFLEKTEEDKIL